MMAPMIPHREKRYHDRGKSGVLKNTKHMRQNPLMPATKAMEYPLFITSRASSR